MAPFRVEGMRVTFRVSVKPRSQRDRLRFDHTGKLRLEIRAALLATSVRTPEGIPAK